MVEDNKVEEPVSLGNINQPPIEKSPEGVDPDAGFLDLVRQKNEQRAGENADDIHTKPRSVSPDSKVSDGDDAEREEPTKEDTKEDEDRTEEKETDEDGSSEVDIIEDPLDVHLESKKKSTKKENIKNLRESLKAEK